MNRLINSCVPTGVDLVAVSGESPLVKGDENLLAQYAVTGKFDSLGLVTVLA